MQIYLNPGLLKIFYPPFYINLHLLTQETEELRYFRYIIKTHIMKTLCILPFILSLLFLQTTACSRAQETTAPTGKTEVFMPAAPANPQSWTDTTLQLYTAVQLIFEDSRGNIWFGTQGKGVCKFDGTTYTYFREFDGWLRDSPILSIQEDKFNNIWIQNSAALFRYNGNTFTSFPLENRTETPEALRAQKHSSNNWKTAPGDLWFRAGANGQVVQLEDEAFNRLSIPKPANNSSAQTSYNPYWVFSLLQDSHQNLWLGTLSGGLIRYTGKQFAYLGKETQAAPIMSLMEDSKGNIWAGNTAGEVFLYNAGGLSNFSKAQQLIVANQNGRPGAVWTIEEDAQGNIWFGTEGGGAYRFDGQHLKQFSLEQGLSDTHILSIHQADNGTLWFGTARGGVYTFENETFHLQSLTPPSGEGC